MPGDVYLTENHKKDHDFKKANKKEQSNYWELAPQPPRPRLTWVESHLTRPSLGFQSDFTG